MDAIGQCHGKPVVILRVEGHRKYFVDEKAFCSIIDQVGDCPIAIYSQNGSRRRGKSLSLNYMKRFLTVNGDINWMEPNSYSDKTFVDSCFTKLNLSDGNQSPQLSDSSETNDFNINKSENFFWQDGDEDTTQGIVMWSKPFKVTLSDGQQVAVLLMDCQGNASDASDNVDNGVIFSLSMLLSSVFIYNISGDLDNLALQFFHQYADFAVQILENNYSETLLPPQLISSPIDGPRYNKYFQELIIWVRDWQGHRHYPLGFYSDNREPPNATKNFKLDKADPQFDSDKQSTEVRSVRIAINSMFQRVSCFLSPFPGEKVVSEDFNGYIEPTSQFGQCMKQFVEIMLSPTNIVTKLIGKRKLYSSDLKSYFLKWASVYRDTEKLPKFKSATETSHELICRDAIKEAWDHYMEQMSIVSKLSVPLEPDAFKQRHTELVKECLEKYNATANVGLFQVKLKFMKELVTQIGKSYSSFVDSNNERWERIHQDLAVFALRWTPYASAFVYAVEGIGEWQHKNYKEAVLKFFTATVIGALDVVSFGTASTATKVVARTTREVVRGANAVISGKASITQLKNLASNSSANVRYAAAGMVKSSMRKILKQTNSSVTKEYDEIKLRRVIAGCALEDMNMISKERQEQLLDVLEKKWKESAIDCEKVTANDLVSVLEVILESVSRTAAQAYENGETNDDIWTDINS